jgi:hypothetical protein
LTDDHVPPKCLFVNRPSDLITVPSCAGCNQGASQDDDYFRLVLTIKHDAGDHPEAKGAAAKAMRGLARPQARGFRQSLFQSLTPVEVFSSGGIYLGNAGGYNIDLNRLSRVVRRITTGLFYHEFGAPLPTTHEATAWCEDGLRRLDGETRKGLQGMCATVQCGPGGTIGEGVFTYWFQRTAEEPNTSMWVMIFYGHVGFISMTAPKVLVEQAKRERASGRG